MKIADLPKGLKPIKEHNFFIWYIDEYPEDKEFFFGRRVRTWQSLVNWLNSEPSKRREFYERFGISDSIVRERIFNKLSELINVDYEDIYKKWLALD